jgi:hypothetical protein
LKRLYPVDVVFYSTDEYRAKVEKTGSTYAAYPFFAKHKSEPNLNFGTGIIRIFLSTALGSLDHLIEFVDKEQPDLIFYDGFGIYSKYLFEFLNYRHKREPSKYREPPIGVKLATSFASQPTDWAFVGAMYNTIFLRIFRYFDGIYTSL